MGLKEICTLHSAGTVSRNTPTLKDRCSEELAHLLMPHAGLFVQRQKDFSSAGALLGDYYTDHLNH